MFSMYFSHVFDFVKIDQKNAELGLKIERMVGVIKENEKNSSSGSLACSGLFSLSSVTL
jgi:hypothetical protein